MAHSDCSNNSDSHALSQAQSDRKLHALLGIDHFNSHFKKIIHTDLFIRNVYMPDTTTVHVELAGTGLEQGTIGIWPADESNSRRYLEKAGELCFSYMLDDPEKFHRVYEFYIRYLCSRLKDISFEDIDACFDEKRKKAWRRIYGTGAEAMRKKYFGNPDQWRNFLCTRALERNISGLVRILNPVAVVHHGELECRYATLSTDRNLAYFFNYPWSRQPEGTRRCAVSAAHFDTDIDEKDLIMGPRKKLESMLDTAAGNLGDAEMLWINSTCISDIVGDDFEDLAIHAASTCGVPVFCSGPKTNVLMKSFSMMIDKYRGQTSRAQKKRTLPRNTINLLGFPCVRGADEITELLGAMGVNIHVRMLPEIDFSDLGRIEQAPLNILYTLRDFEELYETALAGIDNECLRAPAPYGMEKTGNWLRAIAEKTGKKSRFHAFWNRAFKEAADEWRICCKQASAFRLAFVVDGPELDVLLDEEQNFAIDPLHFIQEMGFQIRFLVWGGDTTWKRTAAAATRDLEHCDTQLFSSAQELDALLAQEDIHAVYSDYFFDDRILKAGKPQFSLGEFEMGIHGAVRTVQALLRTCRLPFYSRFKNHLQGGRQPL